MGRYTSLSRMTYHCNLRVLTSRTNLQSAQRCLLIVWMFLQSCCTIFWMCKSRIIQVTHVALAAYAPICRKCIVFRFDCLLVPACTRCVSRRQKSLSQMRELARGWKAVSSQIYARSNKQDVIYTWSCDFASLILRISMESKQDVANFQSFCILVHWNRNCVCRPTYID